MMGITVLDEMWSYVSAMGVLEFLGLLFGLGYVLLLIKENIWTWVSGMIYVAISLIIFWQTQLYGDFLLHILYLALNIYGWWEWYKGSQQIRDGRMKVTTLSWTNNLFLLILTIIGVLIFQQVLLNLPSMIEGMAPASLPFWDSTTSILSVTGIWLTAKKKIENWVYWLVVDILATGIYFYKELYFYSLLYFVYIGLAIIGYLTWRRSMLETDAHD